MADSGTVSDHCAKQLQTFEIPPVFPSNDSEIRWQQILTLSLLISTAISKLDSLHMLKWHVFAFWPCRCGTTKEKRHATVHDSEIIKHPENSLALPLSKIASASLLATWQTRFCSACLHRNYAGTSLPYTTFTGNSAVETGL